MWHTKMHFSAECNSGRIAIQWFHIKHYLDYQYTKFQPYIPFGAKNVCFWFPDQTTGSKYVRKEHYISFCCIRWFVNMLYRLPKLLASWFQRIFPDFFFKNMSLWEQMTPVHGQFLPQGHGWPDLCRGSLKLLYT